MTAIVVNRNYNLQDNELIIFANSLINYLIRGVSAGYFLYGRCDDSYGH